MSADSTRLERSRQWLEDRKRSETRSLSEQVFGLTKKTADHWSGVSQADQPSATSEPTNPFGRQPIPAEAEWHSEAYRAAEACKKLHQAEAELIDAVLASRGSGKFRRGSRFIAPPKNNLDRNFIARVWFVAKMIEQKSWNSRAKGKHGGAIGAVGLEVLRTLLFVIKKVDGRLYPSLEAIAKLSRKSKQAVVAAIKVLERMGFITVHRRVKRIETPYGRRVVQDSNAYEFHLPATGLGALAMAVFCSASSESTKSDAIKHQHQIPEDGDHGNAAKRPSNEEADRWWLALPLQMGNGSWR